MQNIAPVLTRFTSFNLDANTVNNSLITIGELQFRVRFGGTCTSGTNSSDYSYLGIRSITGNLSLMLSGRTYDESVGGITSGVSPNYGVSVNSSTFDETVGINNRCYYDGHQQFILYSLTDKTFYRVNVQVTDTSTTTGSGFLYVEYQK